MSTPASAPEARLSLPVYEGWGPPLGLFALLTLLCFGSHVWLERALEARGRPVGTDVGVHVDLLGRGGVEEVRARADDGALRFAGLSRSALPNIDGAYFLRIPLEPWMAGRIFELAPPSAVELRVSMPDGEVRVAGGVLPPELRPVWAVGAAITLPEAIVEGDALFVEARSSGPVRLGLRVYTRDAHRAAELVRLFAVAFYAGIVIVMVALNLTAWRVFRERYYLDYSCFLVAMGVAVIGLSGFATLYVWGGSRLLSVAGEDFALLAAAFAALLFTRDFLDTRRNLPVIDSWLVWLTLACVVLFIASTLLLDERSIWVLLGLLGPILVAFCACAAFVALRRGVAQARWVVLSWLPLAIAVFGGVTSNLGWHAISLASLFRAASSMEMLLLSSAIAARIAWLRRERDRAVEAASRAHEAVMEERKGRLCLLEGQVARHRRAAETALGHAEARRAAMMSAAQRLAVSLRSGHRRLQAITLRAEQWRGGEAAGFELLMGDIARAADELNETLADEIRGSRAALGIGELVAQPLETVLRAHVDRLHARGARASIDIAQGAELIQARIAELESGLLLLADLMTIAPGQPLLVSAHRTGLAIVVTWESADAETPLLETLQDDPVSLELRAQLEAAAGDLQTQQGRPRLVFRAANAP